MITELKKFDNGTFEVVIGKELVLEDLMVVRDFIDEMIAESKGGCRKIFGCLNLKNVSLPSTKFFQKDLGLIDKYKSYIGGMAIVGDEDWEKAWFKLVSSLANVKIKFFASKAKARAKKWLDSIAK